MPLKLGFLGTGAITSAMVTGLCSGGGRRYAIRLSPRNAETGALLAGRYREVSVAPSNQAVVDESEMVVIAVRPQIAEHVLSELRFREGQKAISLVSGFSVRRVAGLVAPAGGVTRAVPLPSAAQRRSPTAMYPRDEAAVELFALLGTAFAVDTESEFDALCTATATMAAYFAYAETTASWLGRNGIAPAKAREYVAEMYAGLAGTAVEAPERSFHELAADHATRGGINEQVINYLVEHGVFQTFSEVLDAVMRRVSAASR